MSFKKCEKCLEMVDEAKAFCPECGNSFEAEQTKPNNSEFELTGGTVQFSQSAFNILLSDMGLNITESEAGPKNPVETKIQPPLEPKQAKTPDTGAQSSKTVLIIAAAALALFIGVTLMAGVIGYLVYRN